MSMNNAFGSNNATWTILFLCWLIVTVSTLGSLFFSELMDYAPCLLCWWQRIFLFPLVFIFTAALNPMDKNVSRYALPLVLAG